MTVHDNRKAATVPFSTIKVGEMFTDEDDYDLIVLDPYDFYSGKLSIDELEEFSKENNLAILITTNNEQLISKC